MSGVTECCLLIDPPGAGVWNSGWNGAWNMAVDEVLLESAAESGDCYWRFYCWSEPTVSLGYFQDDEDRRQHAASRDCPAVRRLSGGGAIVHDKELTYSVALPSGHRLAGRRDLLYESVHSSLVNVLGDLGIVAYVCQIAGRQRQGEQPFLCFERRSRGDVLVGGVKIGGSAQRRRRGAVLQHGSVLLGRSAAAPELPALADLAPNVPAAGELVDAWSQELAAALAITWRRERLSAEQRRRAAELVEDRYASARWTRCRQR